MGEQAPLLARPAGGWRRRAAGGVAAAAALAALALVALAAAGARAPARDELLARAADSRRAVRAPAISDADAAAYGAQRNGADWDQGWLDKFVHGDGAGARPAAEGRGRARGGAGASGAGSRGDEMEQIHSLLNKAVTMMGDLDHGQQAAGPRAARTSLPEAEAPAAEDGGAGGAPAFEMNRESKERLAKYEQFKRQTELPACFKLNKFTDQEKVRALQRMSAAADNLKLSYPGWAKGVTIPGKGQDGEWRHDRGPPYVKRITMFAGPGVDTLGNGNLVRRVLGLTTAFQKVCDMRSCDHAMTGNQYIRSFDSAQFRFLYRNACSNIVIPPLTKGAGPVLGDNALFRLHHYLKDGYNTMIVCGSTASVLFLNQNVATLDGGFQVPRTHRCCFCLRACPALPPLSSLPSASPLGFPRRLPSWPGPLLPLFSLPPLRSSLPFPPSLPSLPPLLSACRLLLFNMACHRVAAAPLSRLGERAAKGGGRPRH